MGRTRQTDPSSATKLSALPFAALRASLREGYGAKDLRRDLQAGFLVGVVALPLSMALSIAVGLPPQHGLYTAMIAGFLTALMGGSRIQVVGPTAAFIVILAPIVQKYGFGGLLLCGLMAGAMLAVMALLRLGSFIEYIPFPVTTGFTSGIALVIAGLQLKDFFGVSAAPGGHFLGTLANTWQARGTASGPETLIAALTLGLLLSPRLPKRWLARLPRALRRTPAPLFALPLAAAAAWLLSVQVPGFHVQTLGERFHSLVNGVEVPGIPRVLPAFLLPWQAAGAGGAPLALSPSLIRELLPSAFAVAMLGAIESLLSAVVADGMARTRHDPDAELLALGLSNLVTPFFGGIPATGAIARTATNYRMGGRSPVASMVHALTIFLAVLILAPALAWLPMASLASLLLLVAWNMSELKHFIYTLRVAPRSEAGILLICFGLTVGMDMVVSITTGVVLGSLLFMRRMAQLSRGGVVTPPHGSFKGSLPEGVILYEINGPFFFGAVERAMGAIRSIGVQTRVVLFEMDRVPAADLTGLVAMQGALEELHRHGVRAVIVGAREPVRKLFEQGGIRARPGRLAYASSIAEGIRLAKSKSKPGSRAA